jgi:hypothetical protein
MRGDTTDPKGPVPSFDKYSWKHFAFGVLLGRLGTRASTSLILAVAWEIPENSLKIAYPEMFPDPRPDTWGNSIADVFVTQLGWAVGHHFLRS